jgi:hypothetical protein
MADRWIDPGDAVARRRPETLADEDARARVREELEGRLLQRGVFLSGAESDEQIVMIVDALEAFDTRRMQLGGDSMVTARDPSRPPDERMAPPARRDDESVDQFVRRVREAADRLDRGAP